MGIVIDAGGREFKCAEARLSLREKEDAKSVLDGDAGVKDEINYDIYLVGKFLGEMVVKFNATERTLLALWCLLKGTTIKP
ncbi:hypothetical protein Goshw_000480, partial [Gossypium schwendimanii]|nr:hypothetical protein [Gossypium schwendimanii]